MSGKRALIFGISGQDGSYLARLLVRKGYTVVGVSRDSELSRFDGLQRLGIRDDVKILSASPTDFRSVLQVISDVSPDEIYNLSGQSSVGLSFSLPVETLDSTIVGPLNILESLRFLKSSARLYNACSSECFGNVPEGAANEATPLRPRSPYGVGKAASFWTTENYREAYGIFACSGILFNHESPLRPRRFVTQKVVSSVCDIAAGSANELELGDLSIQRDFGWAPEYVDAMHRMLCADVARDYVIATGVTSSLEDFVRTAFSVMNLDWRNHVRRNEEFFRPTDISRSAGDPSAARRDLGWRAETLMENVVEKLIDGEKRRRGGDVRL